MKDSYCNIREDKLKKAEKLLNDLPAQNKFRQLFSLAILEETRKNKNKSLVYAEKAIKLNFKNMLLLWEVGHHYKGLNNPKEAEKYFSTAYNLNPFDRVCLFEKIFCLKEMNKKGEALEALDSYIKINPRDKKIVNYRPKFVKILGEK